MLLLCAPVLVLTAVACGGDTKPKEPPTPAATATPELTVAERAKRDLADLQASKPPAPTGIAALSPDVRAAVAKQPWGQAPLDAQHQQLVNFLVDASQNLVGVRSDWPYISRFDRNRFVNTPFDSETEVNIVQQTLYDFVPMQKGTVVVVFSSADANLQFKDVQPVLIGIRKWLPKVEQFVGRPFRTSYLNIQVAGLVTQDVGIQGLQNGSNIFLDPKIATAPDFDFVLAHELTHTYVAQLPADSRPWLREGIADLVGGTLTGVRMTGYTEAATHEPLPIDVNPMFQPSLFSAGYSQEAGNGSLFLFEVLKAIGPDNMSKVVSQIHGDEDTARQRHANDLFDIIRANTPYEAKANVEAIIQKWTVRTAPVPPAAPVTPGASAAPSTP